MSSDGRNGHNNVRGGGFNGFMASNHQKPQTAYNSEYSGRGELTKVTSQTRLGTEPLVHMTGRRELQNVMPLPNPARQSEMISGLRSQLLNIRSEVSKLLIEKPTMNASESKTSLSKRLNTTEEASNVTPVPESRASESVRPKGQASLRILQTENDSLKQQLAKLKRRYVEKKQLHQQEIQVLNKKLRTMELTLKTNEENVLAYKADIEKEMQTIKNQLTASRIETKKIEMDQEVERHRQQSRLLEQTVSELEQELLETRKVYTDRLNECEEQIELIQQRMLEKNVLIGRLRGEVAHTVPSVPCDEVGSQTTEGVDQEKEGLKRYVEILRAENSNLDSQCNGLSRQLSEIQQRAVQAKFVQTEATQSALGVNLAQIAASYAELKKQYGNKVEELRKQEIFESQRFAQTEAQIDSLQAQVRRLEDDLHTAREEASSAKRQLTEQRVQYEAELLALTPRKPRQTESPKDAKAEVDKQQYIVDLCAQNQQLAQELSLRDRMLQHTKGELKQLTTLCCQSSEQLALKDRELNDLRTELTDKLNIECNRSDDLLRRLEAAELNYQCMLDQLRAEIRSLIVNRSPTDCHTFDEALRQQIAEINELKAMLNRKNDEIYQLKDTMSCNRSQVENIRADMEIEKLKAIAERKNMQVGFEVELQKLRNQADNDRKLSESINGKLRAAVEESRSKDEFIQKYVMGKRLSSDEKLNVEEFFRQYQLDVPVGKLREKLSVEVQEIHRLEQAYQRLLLELSQFRLCSRDKLPASQSPTRIHSEACLSDPDLS